MPHHVVWYLSLILACLTSSVSCWWILLGLILLPEFLSLPRSSTLPSCFSFGQQIFIKPMDQCGRKSVYKILCWWWVIRIATPKSIQFSALCRHRINNWIIQRQPNISYKSVTPVFLGSPSKSNPYLCLCISLLIHLSSVLNFKVKTSIFISYGYLYSLTKIICTV